MKRYKPYPKYKDSGVEWLGGKPEHWEVKRVKRLFNVINGATPKSDEPEYWDGEIPWVTPDDLGRLDSMFISFTSRLITSNGYKSCGTSIVPEGSLILSTRAPIGHHAITAIDVCTNQGCRSLSFRAEGNSVYYHFVLHSLRPVLEMLGDGSTFKELSREKLQELAIPEPEISEQNSISRFLQRETAKIDALIAKKKRFIELLKEKRTALISHAVTKGLDPNVPMKDSGVEWLGKIPEHWQVMKLKHLLIARKSAIKTGPFGSQLQSNEMTMGEIKVYNQRSVLDRDFSMGENYISYEKYDELRSFETFPGDLLVTTRGSIGRCAILPSDAEQGILHPCLMRIQTDQRKIATRFLELLIQDSGMVLDQLRLLSNATTIDVIYSESLKNVWIVIPPKMNQEKIMTYLDRETAKIDALMVKVREAIDRLQEYRSALISAAVTGKIDVLEEIA